MNAARFDIGQVGEQRGEQLVRADGDYCAERDGWDFRSPSRCGLLGLVTIFEVKQPRHFVEYWWREEGPELYDHLPSQAERKYQPVGGRR